MYSRVLIVTGNLPPETGGPAKFASEFASWCALKGKQVSVITYKKGKTQDERLGLRFRIIGVRKSRSLIKSYVRMIASIKQNSMGNLPILAVGAFLETLLASLLFGFRYVAKVPGDIVWERARNNFVTELDIDEFQTFKLPLKYKVYRFLFTQSLKRAALVIVPSNGLREFCLKWGVQSEKIRVIYNSVDVQKYLGLNREILEFDVLTVCRLVSWKGVDEVIRYCSYRGLSLAIAGDGPERIKLETLAKSLQAKVFFFGDIAESKLLELMSKSKIFVLNSSYEGLPHALIEARAAGIISIAKEKTGSAEVIHDDMDGFLIRKNRNLSETMDLAFSRAADWSELTNKASADSENRFNKEKNFQKIVEAVAEVFA